MTVVARERRSIAKKLNITAGRLQLESVNVKSAMTMRLIETKQSTNKTRDTATEACRSSRTGLREEEAREDVVVDPEVVFSTKDLTR